MICFWRCSSLVVFDFVYESPSLLNIKQLSYVHVHRIVVGPAHFFYDSYTQFRVLKECADRAPRVLLGIPGNHDWYDGLQGFSRLFRLNSPAGARIISELSFFQKVMSCFHPKIQTEHFEPVQLHGYTPMQSASYWTLPVAPHIDFVAIDRMLKEKRNGSDGLLDRRQQEFFQNDPCK